MHFRRFLPAGDESRVIEEFAAVPACAQAYFRLHKCQLRRQDEAQAIPPLGVRFDHHRYQQHRAVHRQAGCTTLPAWREQHLFETYLDLLRETETVAGDQSPERFGLAD